MVKSADATDIELNNDLEKIGESAFEWKINFNCDPAKQVQMINHPPLFHNQNVVPQTSLQNCLGMF